MAVKTAIAELESIVGNSREPFLYRDKLSQGQQSGDLCAILRFLNDRQLANPQITQTKEISRRGQQTGQGTE
jgi:hypothetical protein